ncbi:hypothetical protein HDU96_002778, partial [Phlyctochytrium bullatum]
MASSTTEIHSSGRGLIKITLETLPLDILRDTALLLHPFDLARLKRTSTTLHHSITTSLLPSLSFARASIARLRAHKKPFPSSPICFPIVADCPSYDRDDWRVIDMAAATFERLELDPDDAVDTGDDNGETHAFGGMRYASLGPAFLAAVLLADISANIPLAHACNLLRSPHRRICPYHLRLLHAALPLLSRHTPVVVDTHPRSLPFWLSTGSAPHLAAFLTAVADRPTSDFGAIVSALEEAKDRGRPDLIRLMLACPPVAAGAAYTSVDYGRRGAPVAPVRRYDGSDWRTWGTWEERRWAYVTRLVAASAPTIIASPGLLPLLLTRTWFDPSTASNALLLAAADHPSSLALLLACRPRTLRIGSTTVHHPAPDPSANESALLRRTRHPVALSLLLAHPAVDPAAVDHQALRRACLARNAPAVAVLARRDPGGVGVVGAAALRVVAGVGDLESVEWFLERGEGAGGGGGVVEALVKALEGGWEEVAGRILSGVGEAVSRWRVPWDQDTEEDGPDAKMGGDEDPMASPWVRVLTAAVVGKVSPCFILCLAARVPWATGHGIPPAIHAHLLITAARHRHAALVIRVMAEAPVAALVAAAALTAGCGGSARAAGA